LIGKIQLPRILVLGAVLISACSSTAPQLSVRLQNPKTGQTLFCTASNSSLSDPRLGADSTALAWAVESCARQLEGHGFVREN